MSSASFFGIQTTVLTFVLWVVYDAMWRRAATRWLCTNAKPAIELSETCVVRLKQLCKESGPGTHLRLSVEGGGCSGFQYKFQLTEQLDPDDVIFEKDGVKVVIDNPSLPYVRGSTIDYHEELIRSAFRVMKNPQAEQGCSCGASFSIKFD